MDSSEPFLPSELVCPSPRCVNHHPDGRSRWYRLHGTYRSCGRSWRRYRCGSCGRTFSPRTFSIDYWTHRHLDYRLLLTHLCSGYSLRGLSRYFGTSVKTVQDRIGRLARGSLAAQGLLQGQIELIEDLVADGLENFCVSQDFPNNIHLLAGKDSQFLYGFNYALFRRKGRMSEQQRRRCKRLYRSVDFGLHTITKGFAELLVQLMRVCAARPTVVLYTDERGQYRRAIEADAHVASRRVSGGFEHVRINSRRPRTVSNELFAVNYLDREVRKDLPEFHRETVCFARNVANSLERLSVYWLYHNFIKTYRIGVPGVDWTHAEQAGISGERVNNILDRVLSRRVFLHDGEIAYGGFFEQLWRRQIPTPLKRSADYLPRYATA